MQAVQICILFLCFVYTNQENVTVSLYYESLCPDCRQFIESELYTGYKKIGDSLVLDLVPFGKANMSRSNGKTYFYCQHGPRECYGNKIQACVLSQDFSQQIKMAFINCIMSSQDPSSIRDAQECAEQNNILWPGVQKCVQGPQGIRDLEFYGTRTRKLTPRLKYVPHILFNGVFNETLEEEARKDFLRAACSVFKRKPRGCSRMLF